MNPSIFKIQTWIETRLMAKENEKPWVLMIKELTAFTYKNAVSCLFSVSIFGLLALSKMVLIPYIPRYDFLLLCCIIFQVVLYLTKLETKDEVIVICIFHVMGIVMECFKVVKNSWSYPEFAYLKIFDVPLYSGFMYASVASYMCQAWRRFELKMEFWPPLWISWILVSILYLNFFTHHYMSDLRWYIIPIVIILFWKSRVYFKCTKTYYKMPVLLSFALIGFFIWLAEQIATFFGAWKYSYQHLNWQPVHLQKLSSWILMSIVSYIIVAQLKFIKDLSRKAWSSKIPD